MSEFNAVQTVLTHMKKATGFHWQRIEDKHSSGIPDLNICRAGREVWVEAKWLAAWPAREDTPVRVPLRPEQALWAVLGSRAGRRVKCLLRVQDPGLWVLFDAAKVDFQALRSGMFNRASLLQQASWTGRFLDIEQVMA